MQTLPPYSTSLGILERRFYLEGTIDVADAPKGMTLGRIYFDTHFLETCEAAGHEPFAAGFVQGQTATSLQDHDRKAAESRVDGYGEPGGPSSNDYEISDRRLRGCDGSAVGPSGIGPGLLRERFR